MKENDGWTHAGRWGDILKMVLHKWISKFNEILRIYLLVSYGFSNKLSVFGLNNKNFYQSSGGYKSKSVSLGWNQSVDKSVFLGGFR